MKKLITLKYSPLLLVISFMFVMTTNVKATVYTLDLALSGQNEVPPNATTASGILTGTYNDATHVLSFNLMFNGLTAPATAAHFHGPANAGQNGPVQVPLAGFPAGVTSGTYSNTFVLTLEQESQLLCGQWYVNIHTAAYPGGEIRSQVKEGTTSGTISTFEIALTGSKEVPPNPTTATGVLIGTYDDATNTLSFDLVFNGLIGTTTAAHFHGPATPGVNAGVQVPLAGLPVGVSSGTYSNTFVLTPAQESDLLNGLWYVNVHTTLYPGGEIRGQVAEGTLKGDCNVPVIPVSGWALVLGGLLIGVFTFYTVRKRL